MKLTLSLAAAALATTFASQAFAAAHAIDPMTLTCSDFMAADADGMMAMSESVDMAMKTADMSEEDKTAMMAEMDAMTEEQKTENMAMAEESMQSMMTACEGDGMTEMTVMEAVEAAM